MSSSALPIAAIEQAMQAALAAAESFEGATAPNPPVGAAALDAEGQLLVVRAHERAGTPHAEAHVLAELQARGLIPHLHTLVVTLEPCNHHGRTPPCSEGILRAGARHVVFGTHDPNPKVAGGGAERLRAAGVDARELEHLGLGPLAQSCARLIEPFSHWSRTGRPWVTVKTAHDTQGSMIPPPGQKTFTSPESLRFAHLLRRKSDAILTGSGTVLADHPEFTVRHLPDHPGKCRPLVILDRRGRTPRDWIEARETHGFSVRIAQDLESALEALGREGVLRVLVEAGPALSQSILSTSLWDEHVIITQDLARDLDRRDRIEIRRRA